MNLAEASIAATKFFEMATRPMRADHCRAIEAWQRGRITDQQLEKALGRSDIWKRPNA